MLHRITRRFKPVANAVRECGYEAYFHYFILFSIVCKPKILNCCPPMMKVVTQSGPEHLHDDGELNAAVEGWLADQDVDFYRSGK